MALKKSQLYSSLWSSCDQLRGGMDASQYKGYVLTLLFMKYVSDKYAGKTDTVIEVPEGGSFAARNHCSATRARVCGLVPLPPEGTDPSPCSKMGASHGP